MEPITMTALALAQHAGPWLVKLLTGSDKAADVAGKVVDVAKAVTGQVDGDKALAAIEVDPNLALQFKVKVEDNKVELERLALQAAQAVNTTMQAEAASEHWPTYSWRPAIGFSVAFNVAITSVVVAIAFAGVILFNRPADALAHIPAMIGAMAALIGVVSPILGIAAWFRGKMQADPSIPTSNRG